jgi:hypothetical protein
VRVENTRIDSFRQGIVISSPVLFVVHLYFGNVSVFTYDPNNESTGGEALLIQPSGRGSVLRAVFVGCQFGSTDTQTSYTGPGIRIDQSMTSGVIDQIRFVSCWSSGWTGNGIQINGAVTNVEILGGYYSCNGQGPNAPSTPIGIELTNSGSNVPSGVRIIGAACNNSGYSNMGSGGFLPKTQKIGVSIPSGTTNIFVRHCDLTGNLTAAVSATTPDTSVHVTECAGYNDRAITLATTHPTKNVRFFAQSAPYYYCGPVAFYATGGSGVMITIDGNLTGLAFGGFTLNPGESAILDWTTGSPPSFVMVGK